MRNHTTILFLLLLIASSCANLGKLQTSAKNPPNWLYGSAKDYFITFGVGDTHEEAKQLAVNKVKEDIIKSIAVSVEYEEELNTSEDVNSFYQSFESNTSMSNDYLEPIKGISTTKIEDFYWEEIRENGVKRIRYHIKYPFSQSELNTLISEFESINAGWERELRSITEKGQYKSVEDILADIDELNYLRKKMPNQKSKVAFERMRLLEAMADDVTLTVLQNSPGKIRYQLTLYNQPITTKSKPDIRYSCPIEIKRVKSFTDQTIVEFTSEACNFSEEQIISVRYNIDGYISKAIFTIIP